MDNISYSLTDSDIKNSFEDDSDVGVFTYDELIKKIKKLGFVKLLNSFREKAIIFLIRQTPKYGHWVAVFLKNSGSEKGIHIFDSYGNKPDAEAWYNGISKSMRERMGEDAPYLLKELLKTDEALYFNDVKYQGNSDKITTCGKWAVVRVMCSYMTCSQFEKFINKNTIHQTPDEFVSSIF